MSPPIQQALSSWYLKLPVKLCFLEASPLICPLANVGIACEPLKVPVFVGRVFFILIRNLDLQNGMCCIEQKEINLHMASPRLKSSLKDIKIVFLFLQTVHLYQ